MEFTDSKENILSELMVELAHRFIGNDAGIKERLKSDRQFNTALALFKDEINYSKLLSSGKSN